LKWAQHNIDVKILVVRVPIICLRICENSTTDSSLLQTVRLFPPLLFALGADMSDVQQVDREA
jgi:hypothetical protein